MPMLPNFLRQETKAKPENYCPVSSTSVTGKVKESIIRDKTVEHMENNNFLLKYQQFHRKQILHNKPLGSFRQMD